jgi:hypothetical protein
MNDDKNILLSTFNFAKERKEKKINAGLTFILF